MLTAMMQPMLPPQAAKQPKSIGPIVILAMTLLNSGALLYLWIEGEKVVREIRNAPWFLHVLTLGLLLIFSQIGLLFFASIVAAIAISLLIFQMMAMKKQQGKVRVLLWISAFLNVSQLIFILVHWVIPTLSRGR